MSSRLNVIKALSFCLMACLLSGCFRPPFNEFLPDHPITRRVVAGTAVGTIAGAIAYTTVVGALGGGAVGGVVGALIGLQHESKTQILRDLRRQDIQFIAYGNSMTLVVPTDKYFMFNSPRLNEICFPGLLNIIKLLYLYPESVIYIAGFTDNVGSYRRKKLLSQAQAETMMTFLWAHNIPSQLLKPEGYGDKNDISDNHLIHGSAQNRRIEIQWFTSQVSNKPSIFPWKD